LVEVRRSGEPVLVDQVDDGFVLDLIRESELQLRERTGADGSYTWTSPCGQRYTVDTRGIVTRH
jgi:hypothetical protein